MASKKSSYQKLKERVDELEKDRYHLYQDFKAYVQQKMSFTDALGYKTRFALDDSIENAIWMGESSFFKELNNGKEK